jgi:hypothetical protein
VILLGCLPAVIYRISQPLRRRSVLRLYIRFKKRVAEGTVSSTTFAPAAVLSCGDLRSSPASTRVGNNLSGRQTGIRHERRRIVVDNRLYQQLPSRSLRPQRLGGCDDPFASVYSGLEFSGAEALMRIRRLWVLFALRVAVFGVFLLPAQNQPALQMGTAPKAASAIPLILEENDGERRLRRPGGPV